MCRFPLSTGTPSLTLSNILCVSTDVADGFGVSQYEMEEICSELMDELSVNRTKMNEYTGMLFPAWSVH